MALRSLCKAKNEVYRHPVMMFLLFAEPFQLARAKGGALRVPLCFLLFRIFRVYLLRPPYCRFCCFSIKDHRGAAAVRLGAERRMMSPSTHLSL